MTIAMVASNTILPSVVADDKRGRIMALFTMSFMGTAPFGSILAGIYLGVLALRANSMLPCAILHFAAACTMDVYATVLRTIALE